MSGWTLASLQDRLRGAPGGATEPAVGTAAVAAVLRLGDLPSVLLMKRTEREGDPWSGHVSFPGGRFEPGDRDLADTAVRETREELGIDLVASARMLGALHTIAATGRASGRALPVTSVTPYVFVETTPLAPVPGPEAESVFWLPIERAASGIYDAEHQYIHDNNPLTFPAWRFDGYVIWGLTYRLLRSLIETVALPVPEAR